MAKQLNVSLAFTADTREAKAQLQDLQRQLNNILKTPSNKLGITDEIREAISATAELSSRLQQATNVNTGNLDFSKFNNSLKQSGQSLSSYGQQLQKLGPTGQQAFLTLTKSIATAEIPIKRTNALVKEFTTTLANTARWQVSSSVLHGLMGSMQSAYRYAQDLNESLNDIRIVTGQSVDQMARFAAEANAAAKALSATTVEYTNASLIYYQQGLNDQQVKERTDITIKMANVSKQSAEVVSDQMTAVWNNFYNGSKSLEYYADVMTALGAATASSADEIAGGLEKFAAIGETIGLSYEYAASALATITSNTRQSEEVVGTALKTIFARIQGLNLGETLDDGTTLNKYSSALEKVGISIFDSAGELKRMDDILNEMGAKWETLNKAQQTALAQTVAGTRQYTQLVALMDNWNKGDSDSMKANLSTAYGSSGALQEQADIYAESWEAARDRVTAAAEKIYKALLNDDFFIDMLNGFEKILTFVSQLIDNLGGLQGVFLALGAIVTKVFSSQISQGLTNMAYNIKMMTKSGRESVEKERRDFIDNAVNSIPENEADPTPLEQIQQDNLRTELTLQSEYLANSEKMSALEAETNKRLIERTRTLKEHTLELAKQKDAIDDRVADKVLDIRGDVELENQRIGDEGIPVKLKDVQTQITNIRKSLNIQDIIKDMKSLDTTSGTAFINLRKELNKIDTTKLDSKIGKIITKINQMGDSPDPAQLKKQIEALNLELDKTVKSSQSNLKGMVPEETRKKVDALTQDLREQIQAERDLAQAKREGKEAQDAASQSIANAKGAQKQWSDIMVESANVAFNVASAISMVNSAIDTLKDPDISGMQKLLTVVTTMSMVLPTIISLVGTLRKLFSSETIAKIANAAATWAQVAAEKKLNEEKGTGGKKTRKNIKDTWEDTKNKVKGAKDTWNKKALEQRASVEGSGYVKHKNGTYSIKGHQGLQSAGSAEQIAGKEAAKALGSKATSVGIAVAGIAIIISTVAMVVNQLNKAEKAVEKAKAAAQSLSENYDNVKASYDNFINAQSGYETATASMEELTKGTVAYQEALMQANEAAGELLATNKNLKYTIEDGKIVIDEDSLEQAKADELKKVETAQAAKMAGQQELNEAEIALNKRDMARDLKSDADKNQKGWNAVIGGVLGAAGAGLAAGGIAGLVTGSVTGPGAIITGIVGAVAGLVTGVVTGIVQETSTDAENEAIDLLAEQAEKDETFLARLKAGEVEADELTELGIKDEALIASLQENGEKVAALVGEMQANTAAINAQNDLVAASALSDNEAVQDSKYKDQIIDIAGDAYGHAYDKAMESEWINTWGKKDISKINGANKEAKKVFEEYLKYAGLEGQGYKLTDTTGTDKNRKFIYEDTEGNEHSVSLEAMQAARAAYEASATLDESATKLAETFTKLADSSNEADQALLSFVSAKNFEDATKGELEDMKEEVGTVEQNEDGTYTQESLDNIKAYLEKTFGESLTDDVAIRYGYESAEAMIQAFATKMADADEAWEDIADNYSQTVKKSLRKLEEDDALDNLSLNEVEKFGKALQQAFNTSGQEGIDTLASMLAEVGEYSDEFANAINGIDWDNATVNDLEIALENAGVECNFTTEQLENLINVMSDGTMVFEKATEIYKQFHDIIDDLEIGDTISTEDFTILKETFGSQMTDYFMQMADGSYKLVSDAKEFYDLVNSYTIENFEKTIDNLNVVEEEINNLLTNYNEDSIQNKSHNGKWWQFGAQGSEIEGYNKDQAQAQYDFLKNSSYSDEDQMAEWREGIENGTITIAQLNAMQKAVEENAGSWDQLTEAQQLNNEQINQTQEALASTATSVGELNDMLATGRINTEEYDKAFQSVMDKEFEMEGLDPDVANEVADAFRDMADAGVEGMEALRDDEEAVKDATVRYMELNEAIEDIYDNYEDYVDVLKAAKKALTPVEKANLLNEKSAKSLRKSLAGLLGTTEDLINADLMATIDPDDFKAAANGNAKAIERIRNQFIDLQAQMYGCESEADAFKQRLAELADGAYIDLNTDPFLNALIQAAVQAGATATDIENMLKGFSIDADVTPFTEELWQATQNAQAAGQNIANATSFTTEVETADVDASSKVELPQYQEVATAQTRVMGYNQVPMSNGFTAAIFPSVITTTQKRVDTSTVPQTVEKTETAVGQSVTTGNGTTSKGGVIVKNAHKATAASKTPSVSNTSRAPVGSSGGGGGGSTPKTKPTSESRKKKAEVVDRYKEVEDKLDDVRDAMEDASKSADRLWGASRVKQLQKVNREIQNEIALLKRQKQEAISYLSIDKTDLISKGGALGALFEFDSSGNIANYEEAMSRVYAAREAMLDSFGAEMDEVEEERLKDFDERLEKLKDAIEQYDETRELIEDLDNTIDDQFNAWQDNNYEILNHTLEVNIEINDRELEILDYYLSKIEDDFYNMAEAGALMLGNLSGKNIGEGGQLGGYIEGLQEYEDHLERLKQSYEKGEISQVAYIEGLQEVQDGLLENLESIQELDKTMMEYYGDTIAAAGEELAKFTDQMEHQSSVLEHYKAILELTGKETDYEAIGIVLEGQAKAAENRVKVNKETADMYREQADVRYAEYQKALAQGNEQAAELYKKQYEAALQAANEAEEEYLSSVEEWAESVRAVLENTMADLSRTLENALTGGTSFDQMSIALERAASLQEEYLTSTNQIYETNKLMRSAQQEIDKMTNSVAKRRLQAFISETKELQNQKELSQYELEIQQAKYDLLLAQIALEEAQQSKSTVRLQRDNEGNFGYVYTADSSQIADAQQKLEDAQNSLYNIGLEGANSYAEKYQQTLSEMYDTLTDLQNQYLEGAFESEEEYHKAVDAAKHYYYDKLTQYSSLYTIALTTDSRVAADAWSSDFQDMIYSTDEWRSAVDTYINDIQSAFQVYGYEMERIANETIGTSLDTIKDKTKEVVDASDKLVSTITDDGGVIDALTSEMNAVANLTGEYANLRSTLQGLLSDYEKLLKSINDTTEAEKDKPDAGGDKPKEPSNPSSPSKPNTPAPSAPQDDGERNYDSTTKQGVALAIWNGNYGWGNGTARKQRLEEKGFNYREIQGIVDRTNPNGNLRSRYGISDLSKYAYSSFDTGGYTGNWEGQYGKLALLHQKELVLNAGDTENFLASMEILERILKVIDLQSASAQIGGLLSSPGFIGSGSQVVEQSVTIEASFPGVQDRNEIEEAFNNLINRASQYANRK